MYLVCGEALFDLFVAPSGNPAELRLEGRAGGSPFNVAIGIARQGGRAALLTGLSYDMLGERLAHVLESEGVETRYLVRKNRRTTLSLVELSQTGSPAYVFYGQGSADCSLTKTDLPVLGPEVVGLHFGSYSIAVPPVADALAALARREEGRFISLDPNVRPTVEPDMGVWRRRIAAFLPLANLVKVSTEDLRLLYPDEAPARVAERWLAAGPTLVVVTDGGSAITGLHRKGRVTVQPPAVDVVDTVGAGDAFQAALLTRLAESGDPAAALQALSLSAVESVMNESAAVAALTCTRAGADIPRRGEHLSPVAAP